MKHLIILCSLFLLLVPFALQAQDTIFFRKGLVPLIGKVSQVSLHNLTFYPHNNPSDSIKIALSLISHITLQNGVRINYNKQTKFIYRGKTSVSNRLNAIKADITFPFTNKLSLGFERSITRRTSLEMSGGITRNVLYNLGGYYFKGVYATLGYKFITSRLTKSKSASRWHRLGGFYLRPEVNFSVLDIEKTGEYILRAWSFSGQSGDLSEYYTAHNTAIILNQGYQVVIKNSGLLDLYWGVGVAFKNIKFNGMSHVPTQDEVSFAIESLRYVYDRVAEIDHQSYVSFMGRNVSPVFQIGIRMGLVLGKNEIIPVD